MFGVGLAIEADAVDCVCECKETRSLATQHTQQQPAWALNCFNTQTDAYVYVHTHMHGQHGWFTKVWFDRFNDPSAGSPTETLLRLLLPLGGRV
jgi:hypothetical protein